MLDLTCYEDTLQNMLSNGCALERNQCHELFIISNPLRNAFLEFRIDLIIYKQSRVTYGKGSFRGPPC